MFKNDVQGVEDMITKLMDKTETISSENIIMIVNDPSVSGSTALFDAAWYGFYDMAESLLNHGGKVDWTNLRGNTPICMAIEQNHLKIVRLFLQAGAQCHPKVVHKIRKHSGKFISPQIDQMVTQAWKLRNKEHRIACKGMPPLKAAVLQGDVQAVEKIKGERNAKTQANQLDEKGLPPLYHAARLGVLPIVKLLIQMGADVKFSTVIFKAKHSALHQALANNHIAVVQHLLKCGADPFKVDIDAIRVWAPSSVSSHCSHLIEVATRQSAEEGEESQSGTVFVDEWKERKCPAWLSQAEFKRTCLLFDFFDMDKDNIISLADLRKRIANPGNLAHPWTCDHTMISPHSASSASLFSSSSSTKAKQPLYSSNLSNDRLLQRMMTVAGLQRRQANLSKGLSFDNFCTVLEEWAGHCATKAEEKAAEERREHIEQRRQRWDLENEEQKLLEKTTPLLVTDSGMDMEERETEEKRRERERKEREREREGGENHHKGFGGRKLFGIEAARREEAMKGEQEAIDSISLALNAEGANRIKRDEELYGSDSLVTDSDIEDLVNAEHLGDWIGDMDDAGDEPKLVSMMNVVHKLVNMKMDKQLRLKKKMQLEQKREARAEAQRRKDLKKQQEMEAERLRIQAIEDRKPLHAIPHPYILRKQVSQANPSHLEERLTLVEDEQISTSGQKEMGREGGERKRGGEQRRRSSSRSRSRQPTLEGEMDAAEEDDEEDVLLADDRKRRLRSGVGVQKKKQGEEKKRESRTRALQLKPKGKSWLADNPYDLRSSRSERSSRPVSALARLSDNDAASSGDCEEERYDDGNIWGGRDGSEGRRGHTNTRADGAGAQQADEDGEEREREIDEESEEAEDGDEQEARQLEQQQRQQQQEEEVLSSNGKPLRWLPSSAGNEENLPVQGTSASLQPQQQQQQQHGGENSGDYHDLYDFHPDSQRAQKLAHKQLQQRQLGQQLPLGRKTEAASRQPARPKSAMAGYNKMARAPMQAALQASRDQRSRPTSSSSHHYHSSSASAAAHHYHQRPPSRGSTALIGGWRNAQHAHASNVTVPQTMRAGRATVSSASRRLPPANITPSSSFCPSSSGVEAVRGREKQARPQTAHALVWNPYPQHKHGYNNSSHNNQVSSGGVPPCVYEPALKQCLRLEGDAAGLRATTAHSVGDSTASSACLLTSSSLRPRSSGMLAVNRHHRRFQQAQLFPPSSTSSLSPTAAPQPHASRNNSSSSTFSPPSSLRQSSSFRLHRYRAEGREADSYADNVRERFGFPSDFLHISSASL